MAAAASTSPFKMLLLLLIFIATTPTNANRNPNRIALDPHRLPHWKKLHAFDNPNQGPFCAQPEQVHLSYGGDPSLMIVTWLTFDDPLASIVEYGVEYVHLNETVTGTMDYFLDGGKEKKPRYTHRATIKGVQPGVRYYYRVGSHYGWSSIFSFVGLKERENGGGYRYAVYGDMGNINARSLGKIQRLAQQGDFDVVLHVGDFAYNLDTKEGKFGDEFMRQLEPVAAYLPYMTVVGNHEEAYNFSHYVNRFTMPGTTHNLFYSFDLGPAHFVVLSTELYFFLQYGFEQLINQWKWLEEDLKRANANREQVPWVITMGHRPMYCSDWDSDDCTRYNSIRANDNREKVPWIITLGHRPMYCSDLHDPNECHSYETIIRTGLPIIHAYGLEKLFYEQGVDLELWAHEHTFERMYPVYNRTVYNGTDYNPYLNPPAPVHVVTGSAGCQEKTDVFVPDPGPWSAFRSSNYGFSRMQIFNSSHLYFEQVLAANDTVEDHFWLVKHSHKPYTHRDKHRLKVMGTFVPNDYCHGSDQCGQKGKKEEGTSDL